MNIWVIKTNWACSNETGGDVTLYVTEKLAKAAFEKAVREDIAYYNIDINDEESGYTVEKTEDYFDIFKNGEYLLDHSTIELVQLPVLEE